MVKSFGQIVKTSKMRTFALDLYPTAQQYV